MKNVILDTDIGPDCDDAAALALLHLYADAGYARPLAVLHCTSMPWGVGAIRAINLWYGRPDLPVGTLFDRDLLAGGDMYERYNKALSLRVSPEQREAGDATALFRETLAAQPDGSVTVVAIGPLRNLANLLRSGPDTACALSGEELVARKVQELVLMAGCFPDARGVRLREEAEWNVLMDIPSARCVAEHWPGGMVYCGFEVGLPVVCGANMARALPGDHPVRAAYRLHGSENGRPSWDLLTVEWALDPHTENYALSPPGRVSIDGQGVTSFAPEAEGRHRYLSLAREPEAVAAGLDALLAGK